MALCYQARPLPLLQTPFLSLPKRPTPLHLPFSRARRPSCLSSANLAQPADPSPDICRLCQSGNLQEAVLLLDSSPQTELEEDAYVALLRRCKWDSAVEAGHRVYSHLCTFRVRPSLKLENVLLSMLVRFEDMDNAWKVFARMPERDLYTWNVIVCGYGRLGFSEEALDMYQKMLWAGARPDVYTLPSVLRTCAATGDVGRGREVHAHVMRFGLDSEVDVLNAVVTMYAKCREVSKARKVFDAMPRRDEISWNAMLSGYFENERCVEGLELFQVMMGLWLNPDLMTMTCVIPACGLVEDEVLGKEVHGYAIKMGFVGEVAVQNALLQMYFWLGNVGDSAKIFSLPWKKDLQSWTTMISGYGKNGLHQDAIRIYGEMESQGLMPDEAVVVSVLSVCASSGNLDLGCKLHEVARRCGLLPSVNVRTALIDMYSHSGRVDLALQIFRGLPEIDAVSWTSIVTGLRVNRRNVDALIFFRHMLAKFKPTAASLISALSACSSIGAVVRGKEIHAYALRSGLSFHAYVPNAILDLYARCGRIEYACRQFASHLDKDVSSWNIMLNGYARNDLGDAAIELFEGMEEAGVSPNELTFVSLLYACSRSGLVDEGRYYFNCMVQKYSMAPNIKHYTCMVDLLSRSGLLDEAYEFIKTMPLAADAAIWASLLNGCRRHRKVDL